MKLCSSDNQYTTVPHNHYMLHVNMLKVADSKNKKDDMQKALEMLKREVWTLAEGKDRSF